LQSQFSTYANCFLFPVALTRRLLKKVGAGAGTDVKPLPAGLRWLDPIFRRVLQAEAGVFASHVRMPFGLSTIVWARKS
jgi:hypothetical protein